MPGIRLTRSDAIQTCLHRCPQDELRDVETMRTQATMTGRVKGSEPHHEEA
jgi:hypothetical protein